MQSILIYWYQFGNKALKVLIISLVTVLSKAQSVSPSVISTGGAIATASVGSLEWALGEVTIETYSNTNGYLTQGFYQNFNFSATNSLSHSVIGSYGGYSSVAAGSIDWTLGEIMIEIYQNSIGLLTQGFHQSILGTGARNSNLARLNNSEEIEFKENEIRFSIYPNPVWDLLNFTSSENGDFVFELFNLQGQKVLSQSKNIVAGSVYQMDFNSLRVAVYLLRVSNNSTGKFTQFKIEKL